MAEWTMEAFKECSTYLKSSVEDPTYFPTTPPITKEGWAALRFIAAKDLRGFVEVAEPIVQELGLQVSYILERHNLVKKLERLAAEQEKHNGGEKKTDDQPITVGGDEAKAKKSAKGCAPKRKMGIEEDVDKEIYDLTKFWPNHDKWKSKMSHHSPIYQGLTHSFELLVPSSIYFEAKYDPKRTLVCCSNKYFVGCCATRSIRTLFKANDFLSFADDLRTFVQLRSDDKDQEKEDGRRKGGGEQ